MIVLMGVVSLGCHGGSAPKAEEPRATPPTAPEPVRPPEPTNVASAATGSVEVASLAGRSGFDWLNPETAECTPVDDELVAKLTSAKAECKAREPEEAFEPDGGVWHSCKAGNEEWLIYEDAAICKNMLETMQANGP